MDALSCNIPLGYRLTPLRAAIEIEDIHSPMYPLQPVGTFLEHQLLEQSSIL